MTIDEFKNKFSGNVRNIILRSKSGVEYIVNYDQADHLELDNDLVYGYFVSRHIPSAPGKVRKGTYRFFKLANMTYARDA